MLKNIFITVLIVLVTIGVANAQVGMSTDFSSQSVYFSFQYTRAEKKPEADVATVVQYYIELPTDAQLADPRWVQKNCVYQAILEDVNKKALPCYGWLVIRPLVNSGNFAGQKINFDEVPEMDKDGLEKIEEQGTVPCQRYAVVPLGNYGGYLNFYTEVFNYTEVNNSFMIIIRWTSSELKTLSKMYTVDISGIHEEMAAIAQAYVDGEEELFMSLFSGGHRPRDLYWYEGFYQTSIDPNCPVEKKMQLQEDRKIKEAVKKIQIGDLNGDGVQEIVQDYAGIVIVSQTANQSFDMVIKNSHVIGSCSIQAGNYWLAFFKAEGIKPCEIVVLH